MVTKETHLRARLFQEVGEGKEPPMLIFSTVVSFELSWNGPQRRLRKKKGKEEGLEREGSRREQGLTRKNSNATRNQGTHGGGGGGLSCFLRYFFSRQQILMLLIWYWY